MYFNKNLDKKIENIPLLSSNGKGSRLVRPCQQLQVIIWLRISSMS